MPDRDVQTDRNHRHSRCEPIEVPVPQPHRVVSWRCRCGAIELDTYPVGPRGAEEGALPIGHVWVAADLLSGLAGLDDHDIAV